MQRSGARILGKENFKDKYHNTRQRSEELEEDQCGQGKRAGGTG